jgi:hypothetical protein
VHGAVHSIDIHYNSLCGYFNGAQFDSYINEGWWGLTKATAPFPLRARAHTARPDTGAALACAEAHAHAAGTRSLLFFFGVLQPKLCRPGEDVLEPRKVFYSLQAALAQARPAPHCPALPRPALPRPAPPCPALPTPPRPAPPLRRRCAAKSPYWPTRCVRVGAVEWERRRLPEVPGGGARSIGVPCRVSWEN